MKDFFRAIKLASINRKLTLVTIFLTLLLTGLDASLPQVIKLLFDLVESQLREGAVGITPSYWLYLGIFGLLLFAIESVSQVRNYFVNKWQSLTKRDLSSMVFTHLQHLSLNYFERNGPGKLRERVDRGINDLNSILEGTFMEVIPQILYISIAVFFLFRIDLIFGMTVVVGIPIFVYISLLFTKKIIATQDRLRISDEEASNIAMQSILNIKTVKSFATEERHENDYWKQLDNSASLNVNYMRIRVQMNSYRFIIINIARLIVISLGTYWTLTGKITIGTLALAYAYSDRSFGPLWHLTWLVDNMQRSMRSVRRVFQLLDTRTEIPDLPDAKPLKVTKGMVEFDNIYFSYGNRKILNGVNLKIMPGQVVAIVGKSGAGKSTLIKLLQRFIEPKRGRVLIDKVDIKTVTQLSLRENLGVVLQETALFNDTIFNNIAYARPGTTKKEVYRAAKIAHAHDFIKKLENKYETIVGEGGLKLSGGEKQRISIARAILKDAPVLVLDEATSSLDSESEFMFQDSLWKMVTGKTAIIIAHRLSTIMKADTIVVMDKGRVIEMNTHDELMKQKGLYSRLFEIQSGGYLQ